MLTYFKIFAKNISAIILKHDSLGYISKIFIQIFERIFQSVAWKDKLEKHSFKYFDKYFRNLLYTIIL